MVTVWWQNKKTHSNKKHSLDSREPVHKLSYMKSRLIYYVLLQNPHDPYHSNQSDLVFHLSRSLKVKSNSTVGFPIYMYSYVDGFTDQAP